MHTKEFRTRAKKLKTSEAFLHFGKVKKEYTEVPLRFLLKFLQHSTPLLPYFFMFFSIPFLWVLFPSPGTTH